MLDRPVIRALPRLCRTRAARELRAVLCGQRTRWQAAHRARQIAIYFDAALQCGLISKKKAIQNMVNFDLIRRVLDKHCVRVANSRELQETLTAIEMVDRLSKLQLTAQGSIVQDWAARLGLRHQGVLMSAVRGCDTAAKHDGCKVLARYYRSAVLKAHCGDPSKAQSFSTLPKTAEEFDKAVSLFFQEWDALPVHYVMHLVHAAEIVGYHHPETLDAVLASGGRYSSPILAPYAAQDAWCTFYLRACRKLHINPETKEQLDARLNATEDSFGKQQKD